MSDRRADFDAEVALDKMVAAIAHRGPDGAGTFHEGGAHLGHRRLAVIDPTPGGAQPMTRGSLTLVLCGELYNYKWLRGRLQRARHSFTSRSDTEVLLKGYEEWGTEGLLSRTDGVFAFAIWDSRTRELVLARDRMGLKSLYWSSVDGGLAFGSELRALTQYPKIDPQVDPTALRKYLAYDYVPAPLSMLQGVHKLEAGHHLTWHVDSGVRIEQWWKLPEPTTPLTRPKEAAATLWEAIRSGVRSRLVSDVPVGIFLSGGLDSSAVATAAVELGARPRSYCLGFDDPAFDESSHAREVAAHLGLEHHEERLTGQTLIDAIPDTLADGDEPHADTSTVAMRLLSKAARRDVKVVLGGDGGDELFLGYPTFGAHGIAKTAARIPAALRQTVIKPAVAQLWASEKNWGIEKKLRRFVAGLDYDEFARHFVWIGGLEPARHRDLLEPTVFAAADPNPFDDVPRLLSRWGTADGVSTAARLYARLYLGEGVLQKVDRATMAFGLEARAPLLSESVLTTAARIDPGLKLRGQSKWILRRALAGKLPATIIRRPKQGFGIPMAAWFKGPLLPLLNDSLHGPTLRDEGFFKAEVCERLLAEHTRGWRDHHKTLWAILVFRHWFERLTRRD